MAAKGISKYEGYCNYRHYHPDEDGCA